MRKRSKAREYALQILYQIEQRHENTDECMEEFWETLAASQNEPEVEEIRGFSAALVRQVLERRSAIDAEIEKCADNWKIGRMALVDRNILRIGACEILYVEEVPSKVAINEAIELAKKFGDADSSKFVNGILDKLAKTHKPCD